MQSSVQNKSTGMSKPAVRGVTLLLAIVAPLLVWAVTTPLLGVELEVPNQADGPPMVVGPMMIVITSLVVGLAGWGLLALLERFTKQGTLVWTVIAAVVLVLSLLSPLAMPGLESATRAVLTLMHIVVGAVLIVGYRMPASR